MKDYENDPDYQKAMGELTWAIDEGFDYQKAKAIDDLITIRLALMMEAQADRIAEETRKLAEPRPLNFSGTGRSE